MSTQLEVGGSLPPIGTLFSETVDDLTKNLGPYCLATLGLMAVVTPVALVVSLVGMVGMQATMFLGIAASAAAGEAAADRDTGALVTLLGTFGSLGLGALMFFACIGVSVAVTAPFGTSLYRGIAAHQRGEAPLTFASAFQTAREGIVSSVAVLGLTTMASLVGALFCYVGALVPAMLFTFAPMMVALHRKGALHALGRCARHALARPTDHLLYAVVWFGTAMVAANIPVLGYAFLMAMNVRAYRKVFGDGAEPVG